MSSELKHKIILDYTDILRTRDEVGAAVQRDTVCKPIYQPIEKLYRAFHGYIDEANLGLGCGLPFRHLHKPEGITVADLGCAAGADSFILSHMVGNEGKVIGIDLTDALIQRAAGIAQKKGIANVVFICADIMNLPLEEGSVDAVVSNGVLSLIPDLKATFSGVYRIMRKGGQLCVADIVRTKDFSEDDYGRIKSFTGCLNGIRKKETYLHGLAEAGFKEITTVEERALLFPTHLTAARKAVIITTIKAIK